APVRPAPPARGPGRSDLGLDPAGRPPRPPPRPRRAGGFLLRRRRSASLPARTPSLPTNDRRVAAIAFRPLPARRRRAGPRYATRAPGARRDGRRFPLPRVRRRAPHAFAAA